LEILVDPETSVRAWDKTLDLAQQHRLSTYDAANLEMRPTLNSRCAAEFPWRRLTTNLPQIAAPPG
jgi:hypothetical protein